MTAQERQKLSDLLEKKIRGDEHAQNPDEAVTGPSGSPNNEEYLCGSCGGVLMTVALRDRNRPEIGFRLGSKGRREIRLCDEGGDNAAPGSLGRELCCAGPVMVSSCPKVSIICGGCARPLFLFEGGAHD